MKFQYYIPSRVLFGSGQLDRLHKQKLPGKKASSSFPAVLPYGNMAIWHDWKNSLTKQA